MCVIYTRSEYLNLYNPIPKECKSFPLVAVLNPSSQGRKHIQFDMLGVCRQRLLEIGQMHAIVNTAVPNNINGYDPVGICGCYQSYNQGLVNGRLHAEVIVSGFEDQVLERRGTDKGASDEVVECHVSHGDCHNGGVGNIDCADHICAVCFGLGEDLEGG